MPTSAPAYRPEDDPSAGPPHVHSQATVALVLAIIGIFVFGIILGPIAIYMGSRARGDIDYSQGHLTGRGRATAAIVLGVIEVVLWAVAVAAVLVAA